MSDSNTAIDIIEGDVLDFRADVLGLKYAQNNYGSDGAVSSLLVKGGVDAANIRPSPGEHVWIDSRSLLPSGHVLFIGVPPLMNFRYSQIEQFAFDILRVSGQDLPDAQHIAITLHGAGYGLDEVEALYSELRGLTNALHAGKGPAHLARISIVERKRDRVQRLRTALAEVSSRAVSLPSTPKPDERPVFTLPGYTHPSPAAKPTRLNLQSTAKVESKRRVFVAMPFSADMEDVFYYGIQKPVRELGYICERVDQAAFTGDILQQVRSRIEDADIVIADLTSANPNVYLEVGYAWGKSRPTVLLIKDPEQLRFDVRGQRCLAYKTIKELELRLTTELNSLNAAVRDTPS